MSLQDKPYFASNYNPEWVAGYFDEFGVGEMGRAIAHGA
jgi:hypothetical protein